MKRRGKHPDKALNAVRVRALKEPGRYADGNGLYLVVDPSGAQRWLLRTVVLGRRRDIGLGSARLVSLAEAREKALEYRRIARDGGDPLALKRKARMVVPTFREAARKVHAEHAGSWRNPKHRAQWINTLEAYAFPVIGDRLVDQVETNDILKVLTPIWLRKPETARRLRQRLRTVLDWAKASGHRSGENPVETVALGLARQNDQATHHAALPFGEVPAFLRKVRGSEASEGTKRAFELRGLTASRTGEVLGARWEEVDLEKQVWTVPAARMKAHREHRVPLPARAVEILKTAKPLAGTSPFLFPGRSPEKPLSNMVFLMLLRRMGAEVTAHGFRSSFRDWAALRTSFAREVCEAALAHVNKDKVEAAYRRSDLFEPRRELMETWSSFLNPSNAKILTLTRGRPKPS